MFISLAFLAGVLVRALYERESFNNSLDEVVKFKKDVKD